MSCVYKDRFSKKTATTRTQLSYNKPITKPFRRSTRSKKTLLKSGIPDMIPEKNVLLNIDRLMGVSPGFNGCTVDISLGQRVWCLILKWGREGSHIFMVVSRGSSSCTVIQSVWTTKNMFIVFALFNINYIIPINYFYIVSSIKHITYEYSMYVKLWLKTKPFNYVIRSMLSYTFGLKQAVP